LLEHAGDGPAVADDHETQLARGRPASLKNNYNQSKQNRALQHGVYSFQSGWLARGIAANASRE
jgi:hypothetical protein